MLHHRKDPTEAYRRVDFDARVRGADSRQLVDLCLEQVIGSVGRAVHAQERGDNAAKSAALTRAISALTALQMGVDLANPTAGALVQLYQSARNAILDCVTRFDARTLQAIRQDFTEIREAMLRSIPA
ncbi:flagellin [Novosphingobium sp. THN1]|jgi:flagellin-specific chaperone FliS|uniref:flagellar export chaperone FliS n=1 Tax=unclassified Novosphingobium TaxID=2644732 RepID=UPI000781244E|nr:MULTISPECIES: flagellar protein FliS [unclassified Novosphingobium]AXU18188.1 flagellin [Novosphingobium sp. THN1]MBA4087151.1 flagellin [Novosphingobium sp.]QOV94296.1 flagellar protein FliS [Novosphingobium sp. ES2-1]